jgi:acetyl-CoA C-acetyltransferase
MGALQDVVIVSACRTPMGKFLGNLSPLAAPDLGAVAVAEAVKRAGFDPALVDEVLMGTVVPAGQGQAPARQAAIGAGLPPQVGATTLNKVCG